MWVGSHRPMSASLVKRGVDRHTRDEGVLAALALEHVAPQLIRIGVKTSLGDAPARGTSRRARARPRAVRATSPRTRRTGARRLTVTSSSSGSDPAATNPTRPKTGTPSSGCAHSARDDHRRRLHRPADEHVLVGLDQALELGRGVRDGCVDGRLRTTPIAPSSLCSVISTTVRAKFGSTSCGDAIRSCPRSESTGSGSHAQTAVSISPSPRLTARCITRVLNGMRDVAIHVDSDQPRVAGHGSTTRAHASASGTSAARRARRRCGRRPRGSALAVAGGRHRDARVRVRARRRSAASRRPGRRAARTSRRSTWRRRAAPFVVEHDRADGPARLPPALSLPLCDEPVRRAALELRSDASRSAPAPTIITWSVSSITTRASATGWRTVSTAATAPARRSWPPIIAASIST